MRLNTFLWETFLESARGREWLDFFSKLEMRYKKHDSNLKKFMSDWADQGINADNILIDDGNFDKVLNALRELRTAAENGRISKKVDSQEAANTYFDEIAWLVTDDGKDLFYADDIPDLSQALYCLHPKFFFPYFFWPNFHVLRVIFEEFGIFFPTPPPKRDHTARFFYYLELCKSLNSYWTALGFAPEHVPVFLYGFAPEVINTRTPPAIELPKPKRAWFVGGGINNNGDFEYLDKVSDKSQSIWQGNKDTEVGDIIVMYCLTPRSHIHSIWRAIQPGSADPFDEFHGKIWIGYPQLVKPITLTDIKADPVLSEMPLVKQNMQGINGRQIPKPQYDRILQLLEQQGTVTKNLPRLDDVEISGIKLKNERDVEERLLEPLLAELGFSSSDWERQVKLRVGRSEKCIPDYLVHISRDVASKSVRAEWVWEAKFSVPTNDQLERDFAQVCSYGRLVNAKGVGLVSKEGLWISSKDHDFSLKQARYWSARQMFQSDGLSEIRSAVGKRRSKP